MTREEAIKYAEDKLNKGLYRLDLGYLNRGLYQVTAREVEFMRVAISALREQSNCIEFESINRTESDTVKLVEIDHVKPVWISVKERLPEDGQSVLTCKNGICDIQTYEKRRSGWLCKGWFWSMATVTHWMPMPEPPKEDTP